MPANTTYSTTIKPRPIRTLFMLTSMPVGGAEMLLVNLVRHLNRARVSPEICCLKAPGPLGEMLASELPVHSQLLGNKYDLRIVPRLRRLLQQRAIDAIVTVGAGDKMFWGRLVGHNCGVPVILSALHSTGWPDGVGRLNRLLTPWTDAFIAVAAEHGRYLVHQEGLPQDKVVVIPNGVDTERFQANATDRRAVRESLRIADTAPVFGIVAALRPEKNHLLFLRAAALVRHVVPEARFLIVGDGPERPQLEAAIKSAALSDHVQLLGTRSDIPAVLAALDVFLLTSHMEANPVSILEAMATGVPTIATRVGSVSESVQDGLTGYLADPGDAQRIAERCVYLARHRSVARHLGTQARRLVVDRWSLPRMVRGYEDLIGRLYRRKQGEPVESSADARPEAREPWRSEHVPVPN